MKTRKWKWISFEFEAYMAHPSRKSRLDSLLIAQYVKAQIYAPLMKARHTPMSSDTPHESVFSSLSCPCKCMDIIIYKYVQYFLLVSKTTLILLYNCYFFMKYLMHCIETSFLVEQQMLERIFNGAILWKVIINGAI